MAKKNNTHKFEVAVNTDYQTQQAVGALLGANIHFESCPTQEGKSTIYIDFTGDIDDRKDTALKMFFLYTMRTMEYKDFESASSGWK
jgi:hypothetical protein